MTEVDLLRGKYQEEIAAKVEFLASGNAKDYADYRHICGVIRGLRTADEVLIDLAKRLEHEDD